MAADMAQLARARGVDVLVAPIGGTAAVYAGPGQPFNKLIGLGLGPPVEKSELSRLEEAFDVRQAPLQVEYAALADGPTAALLARRGYHIIGFENVLGLALSPEFLAVARARQTADERAGLHVVRAARGDIGRWIDVLATGFEHADTYDGPPAAESFARAALEAVFRDYGEAPGCVQYLAHRNGQLAGGGSLRMDDGLAQLSGAATLPEHRRRGAQSALLRARLLDAANAGCDLAVVTTAPGSKSHENVQRAGFTLLYARAIMVREPVPSP